MKTTTEQSTETIVEESNGARLIEMDGIYCVNYRELGHDHRQIYFDWNAASANYSYHAGQDESANL